jgi:23S rRNA (pseudouridine1915-N3)-methyltransferase
VLHLQIVAVGKLKEVYWREGISEYIKRLKPFAKIQIDELPDVAIPDKAGKALHQQVINQEGEAISSRLAKDSHVIALAIKGKK